MSRIIVVGAGIAGLSIAHRLGASHQVLLFERQQFAGGKIHSQSVDGYLFEWGPNGFFSNATELRALVREIGLDGEYREASPAAASRFIYWNGVMHKLPVKPPDALKMTLLSPAAKLRAAAELFVGPRKGEDAREESVFDFIERRFGRDVAERMVAPALLGISGGDAKHTSLDAMFPRLRELETDHGSVIRGMMSGGRKPGRLGSFGAHGLQLLTDRLAEGLGSRLRTGSPVLKITPMRDGWIVNTPEKDHYADGVVLAVPADAAASMVEAFDEKLSEELRAIPYAPMRAIGIAFRSEDVPVPLDGFGFLAARNAGVRILGALYTSTLYPEQAPPGTAYLRVFLGGATDPEAVALSSDQARAIVRDDLQRTLGITAEPIAFHEAIWPRAIPQYTIGHRIVTRRITSSLAKHRGLALAGNAYRGLGLADNVRDALAQAAALSELLAPAGSSPPKLTV
jgi:oxygen-dependent protoporphyrinogen oxidase